MNAPLVVGFESFKRMSGNHRIYYFVGENDYEFVYIADGIFVKTGLLKVEIENEKQFFSDKMFFGAEQIFFRIPNPEQNDFDISGIKALLDIPIIIQDVQDEEIKNINIQREGVGDE